MGLPPGGRGLHEASKLRALLSRSDQVLRAPAKAVVPALGSGSHQKMPQAFLHSCTWQVARGKRRHRRKITEDCHWISCSQHVRSCFHGRTVEHLHTHSNFAGQRSRPKSGGLLSMLSTERASRSRSSISMILAQGSNTGIVVLARACQRDGCERGAWSCLCAHLYHFNSLASFF